LHTETESEATIGVGMQCVWDAAITKNGDAIEQQTTRGHQINK